MRANPTFHHSKVLTPTASFTFAASLPHPVLFLCARAARGHEAAAGKIKAEPSIEERLAGIEAMLEKAYGRLAMGECDGGGVVGFINIMTERPRPSVRLFVRVCVRPSMCVCDCVRDRLMTESTSVLGW